MIRVGIGLTKELVTGSEMCVYIQQRPSSHKYAPAGTMRPLLPLIPPTSLWTEISTVLIVVKIQTIAAAEVDGTN